MLGGPGASATAISFTLPGDVGVDRMPPDLRRLAELENGRVTIRTTDPTRVMLRVCGWAVDQGLELGGLEATRPSLEDVYLRLTEETAGGRHR